MKSYLCLMDIHSNIEELKKNIPSEVTLVAVSKTKSNEEIMQAYEAGQRVFGENKIQEMAAKWEALPKDIVWHMIGHVQTNKVKYMAHFVDLIHGVESLKLLKEIHKQAVKHNRVISCLIQIRIAEEETKFGLPADELESLLLSAQSFSNIKIAGLMGMASFTDNIEQIKNEFFQLKTIFDKTQNQLPECTILSMGMSGDYPLAIQAGSTMIRVGSKIFGQRNY